MESAAQDGKRGTVREAWHSTGSAAQYGKRKKKEAVMAAAGGRGHQGEAMSRQCKLALPIWGREPWLALRAKGVGL